METTFRTKSEEKTEVEVFPEGKETTRGTETKEEAPYLDYEREHGHPHSVDYFELGETWNDPQGGFAKEITLIEEYLQSKIEKGDIANSAKAVKKELKRIEKFNNLQDEERPIVRIETTASYIRFLMDTDKLKFNLGRYGRN